jgi:hypothetical protein
MNHETLEKVTSNKAQVKTVIYLIACIFSSAAPNAFLLAECQPQQKYPSGQPEQGVAKLQIGAQKQFYLN